MGVDVNDHYFRISGKLKTTTPAMPANGTPEIKPINWLHRVLTPLSF
jgi:hypothetical protein